MIKFKAHAHFVLRLFCPSQLIRLVFFTMALLSFMFPSLAQQNIITMAPSMAFGTNGIVHNMFEQSSIDGSNVTIDAKRLVLGAGFNYRVDFRYFFDDYFGIGFQGTMIRGSWQHFGSERKIVYIQYTKRSARVNGFSFAAGIHGRMGDQNVMPYVSLFLGFFVGTMDLVDTIRYFEQETSSRWKYTSLISPYLGMAAGVDIVMSEHWNLFVEAEIQNLTVAPKRGYLMVKDGLDQLEDITVNEKEIVFLDKMTSDYTQIPNDKLPQRELRPYFPLDNFQLRMGIRWVF